jgi:hypothetical protein
MAENILIDTLEFNPPLEVDYKTVIWMFDSYHDRDCCERHELDFEWKEQEFELVKSILSKVDKIEIQWVLWMWIALRMYDGEKDFWFFIPWRWSNNWYYSSKLNLIVTLPGGVKLEYDLVNIKIHLKYDINNFKF